MSISQEPDFTLLIVAAQLAGIVAGWALGRLVCRWIEGDQKQ